MKETNSQIRKQGKTVQQAINISRTNSRSSIAFQGSTPDNFRSQTEAARSMGRLVSYSAERRRLLSIVASDYPQTYLTELFQCSKGTVTAACVHVILFGRGGVPPASFKFSWLCYWGSSCTSSHTEGSPEFSLVYSIYSSVSAAITTAPTEKWVDYSNQLEEFKKNFWDYVGHILRTKHQGDYYRWSWSHTFVSLL